MKKITFILAAATMLLSAQGLHGQTSPVVLDKTATGPNPDGTYTLTLKSYVTGKVYSEETSVPADIVFVMDFSGSMNSSLSDEKLYSQIFKGPAATTKAIKKTDVTMTPTTKDAVKAVNKPGTVAKKTISMTNRTVEKTQPWTYNKVTANPDGTANYSHFYRDENGDYYAVRKWEKLHNSDTGLDNVFAIGYVDKNGTTWYLTPDGRSSTYQNITKGTDTQWNGTLYKGWTYRTSDSNCNGLDSGNADGNVASQWYYLHTNGDYYPVHRAANLDDGEGNANVYAAWVVIDGVTWYLHGDKLDTTYDKTMKSQYRAIWFGPLYKGGWTPANIIAATLEGGHYYQYTDGKRYPVQKATEQVNGKNTTQLFVEIPGVGKRYLNGIALTEDPCYYTTATSIPFFFGELYTGGWKTSNITDGTAGASHYYLHTDGEYYPVREIAVSGNHQAYVELPEGKYYFDGNGLAATPDTPYSFSTTNQVTLYFGTLYTMTGWTPAAKAATAGGGNYYLHTDNHYYPLYQETLTDPTTTYQLYVEVPEGKRYLWGHSLHTDPCPFSAATTTVMWYGTLYKGGWTYNTVTENTHLYKHSDGEYYPLKKEKVGSTFQVYAMIPNSGGTLEKKYVWGHGAHDDPCPYSLLATVNLFFEPLYTGGWTYNNITVGTAANGFFYRHSDEKYYPVLKAQEGTLYQAYVLLPEGKRYLYGSHISENPYPYATTNAMCIYTGPLYKGGWLYSDISKGTANGGHYYKHTDGEYYPVTKTTMSLDVNGTTKTTYQVYVDLPDPIGRVYLAGSDVSPDPYLYAHADGSSIYFGTLYQLKGYTKYEGLKNAVLAFIDEMAAKSELSGIQHRIALTQFAFSGWGYSGGNADRNYPHLKTISTSAAAGYAALLADLMDVTVPAQRENLVNTMATPPFIGQGHTVHAWGLSIANGLFKREAGDDTVDYDGNGAVDTYETATLTGDAKRHYADRPKVVIVIGDGEETDNKNWGIEQANKIKSENENVTIFFVHVSTKAINDFEKAIATDEDHVYKVDYYDEELIEALLRISQDIGGAAIDLGSTAIVQDVVAPEFSVPADAEVQMFTANCIDGPDDNLTFEGEDNWETFTGTVVRTDNAEAGTTTIRVTGFDFSANWCGYHGTDEGYAGKQLILQFPIIPKDGVVGGMIDTNTPDSKLLDEDGKPVEEYPIPTVGPFPMHIQISKTGLRDGESAVFQLWRKAKTAADFDKTGAPFMKVVLTGDDTGNAVVADIVDLDPDFDYLVEETGWSWKYTPDKTSLSTVEHTMNPFEFANTAKTVTTKSGEDKVKNEFF